MLVIPVVLEIAPKEHRYSFGILAVGGTKRMCSLLSIGMIEGEPVREFLFSDLWLPALRELINKYRN